MGVGSRPGCSIPNRLPNGPGKAEGGASAWGPVTHVGELEVPSAFSLPESWPL